MSLSLIKFSGSCMQSSTEILKVFESENCEWQFSLLFFKRRCKNIIPDTAPSETNQLKKRRILADNCIKELSSWHIINSK